MLSTKKVLFAAVAALLAGASAQAGQLTFEWNGSSTTWASAASWNRTGTPNMGDTHFWPGGDNRVDDIVVITNQTNVATVDAPYTFFSLELQPSAVMTFSNSTADITVTNAVYLRDGSTLDLTNPGNELIMNTASAQIVVDASGGGASSATISGSGDVFLNANSLVVSIPDASSDALTLTDATIKGKGTITGSGQLINNGLVQAISGGVLMMDTNLNLVDDDNIRWSAIDNSSQLVFAKSHTVAGSNPLLGTFSIDDSSNATFTFNNCSIETTGSGGEFYINGVAQTGACMGLQGTGTWHYKYHDLTNSVFRTCP